MGDLRGEIDLVGAEAVEGLPGNAIDLEVSHGGAGPGVANEDWLADHGT